jgi:hypothetical protein
MTDDVSFRLAYDEAVRALRAQADAHGGLRQRAATVLATSLLVTSFFGGQADAHNATPSSTGWLAVGAFLLAGVLSVFVLFPRDLAISADVAEVVALVERAPAQEPYRELALTLSTLYTANHARLSSPQWIFRAGASALLLEGLLWILFLARS